MPVPTLLLRLVASRPRLWTVAVVLITNHVLVGALIGVRLRRPLPAFAAGVASHLLLDALPHWGDAHEAVWLRVAVIDGLIGLTCLAVASWKVQATPLRWAVPFGMLGGAFLDSRHPLTRLGLPSFPDAVNAFHSHIQQHESATTAMLAQQVVVAAVLMVVVTTVLRRVRR